MAKDTDGKTGGEFPGTPSEPAPKSGAAKPPKQVGDIAPRGVFLE